MVKNIFGRFSKYYTQGDEERIISAVFNGIQNGFYIDIGAHHPIRYSNTYKLYQLGWRGICFEPNERLHKAFKQVRPRDTLLPYAASNYEGEAEFFIGQYDVHSSLSHSASRHQETIKVNVRKLESILQERGVDEPIDLISIDTEGTEVDVLEGLNLSLNRPRLIIAEFNTASNINKDLQPYLIQHDYQILAVTCWNVIATDKFETDYVVHCPMPKK